VTVKHSTFEEYTEAVMKEFMEGDIQIPVKTDDFFPYADKNRFFWTGFFTSRPRFKYYIR